MPAVLVMLIGMMQFQVAMPNMETCMQVQQQVMASGVPAFCMIHGEEQKKPEKSKEF